jgi:hypothetical protein
MIWIDSVKLVEVRGIRELDLNLGRKSFVISGPNGSGKSGVIDGVQFALTGEISRLAGKGTAGLTVQRHGPHVDRRDDPAVAIVTLNIFLPETQKTAVLTRNMKRPTNYSLVPNDPDIRSVIEEVAQHPELTLSRREIIKYILVEAGERSSEIQALLKLDDIGRIRAVLNTVKNKLSTAHTSAEKAANLADDAVRRHLDVETLSNEEVLGAINRNRALLELSAINELRAETALNSGVLAGGSRAFNKVSALRDLEELQQAATQLPSLASEETAAVVADVEELQNAPELLEAIHRRSFIEQGLSFIDGVNCPLCDASWADEEHLKEHLQSKLARSEMAEKVANRILANSSEIANRARQLAHLVESIRPIAATDGPAGFSAELEQWTGHLKQFADTLSTIDGVLNSKSTLAAGWTNDPPAFAVNLETLTETVKAKPDQSSSVAAQTFLTLAQDRWTARQRAWNQEKAAAIAASRAKFSYKAYCDAAGESLQTLYSAVETDFSTYYRELNADDESGFKAKFEPAEGKLDLAVDFYDRGMFPPGAYHSEGHQDGMGVCLYLALMKRLLGERFRFALLDDVVMSVDSNHRKQFCKLLKRHFPNTQFVITTHDKVWAKQMQTEGLIGPRAGVAFHKWSVSAGPIFEPVTEVWDQIEHDLGNDDISTAAQRLRRYLEYVAAELADELGARPVYRGDFSHDLGDLIQPVIGRQGELLKLAVKSAESWGDDQAKARVAAMKAARSSALEAYGGENWVVNKAVHYNHWADFSASEFRDVVAAFQGVLQTFRCPAPGCGSWLYVEPKKGDPSQLRCQCMSVNLNLTSK